MSVIQPRNEVGNPSVGTNPVPQGESLKPDAWTRFTAVCSIIAESFLSDSGRECGPFACRDPVAATDSVQSFQQVKMLVDDKVVSRARKRPMTTRLLRKAGPEFKAGILALRKNLQRTLPIVVEENEYLETPLSGSMRSVVDTASNFESTDSSASHGQCEQSLAKEFAGMGDFDFAAAPNPFRQVESYDVQSLAKEFAGMGDFDFAAVSNPFRQVESHGDASQESISALTVGKQQAGGSQRIVDFVPSNLPATRQQMLVNFRGKIIAENFKAMGLSNIHNEAALSKLLKNLEQAVSDKNIGALDALTPSQAHNLFESYCQKLKVSPLRKGLGQF